MVRTRSDDSLDQFKLSDKREWLREIKSLKLMLEDSLTRVSVIGLQNYIAGPQTILRNVLKEMLPRVGLTGSVIEINVGDWDQARGYMPPAVLVSEQLKQHRDQLLGYNGQIIPVVVIGFEKNAAAIIQEKEIGLSGGAEEKKGWFVGRFGHDYNQFLRERPPEGSTSSEFPDSTLAKELLERKKRLAVFTLIDFSYGKEAYDLTVASAASSQFKNDIMVIESGGLTA